MSTTKTTPCVTSKVTGKKNHEVKIFTDGRGNKIPACNKCGNAVVN